MPKAFEATELSTEQLAVYNLARDLAQAPDATTTDGAMFRVQQAVREGRYQAAIDVLLAHLDANGLTAERRQRANHARFAELRKLRRTSQLELAKLLGIRASALSQFEAGKGGLELPRLLLAADALSVPPEQFFRELEDSGHEGTTATISDQ